MWVAKGPSPSKIAPMLVKDATFAAIDFESAGARAGATDVPVQIGIAVMHGTEIDRSSLFRSYVKADQPVTWGARRVHGISDEDIAEAPTMLSLWPAIKASLGDAWVVAHGSGTERRFLRVFPFHGFGPWIDTLKLAHAALPGSDDHSLGAVVSGTGLTARVDALCPDGRWHDALYDAVASLVFLQHVIECCRLEARNADTLVDPNRSAYFSGRLRV